MSDIPAGQPSVESTLVKLQSDQFIIPPVTVTGTVYGDSCEYEVDLARQACQCDDFVSHRQSFPIGDPRRFCRHLIQTRSEHLDDLPPFLQSLIDARSTVGAGMPNGSTFAFFEIDGRLGFFGENRNQTTYFFVSGADDARFYEFVYDRQKKEWLGETKPDSPDRLLVFAFKERGQYVTETKTEEGTAESPRRARRRRRKSKNDSAEVPSIFKYLLILLVTAGLIAGGFYLFKDGTPQWLASLVGMELPKEPETEPTLPSNEEMIESHKTKTAEEAARQKEEQEKANLENQEKDPADEPATEEPPSEITPLDEDSNEDHQVEKDESNQLAFRNWNTKDGKFSVSARYKSFRNGTVTLVREEDLDEVEIEEDLLSEDDQTYLKRVRRERRLKKAREERSQSKEDSNQ